MAQAIALVGRLAWRGAGSVLELFWLVRTFFDIFPVEVALTLGVIFFGLTWIRPRPIVALPVSGRRAPVLFWSGVVGSLAILAAATWTSWLATRNPLEGTGGWWQRPAPLLFAAAVVLTTTYALRREPLPAPGERAISPRRSWWEFTPRALLWVTVLTAAVLFVTSMWQTLIGVALPDGANRYGIGPEDSGLPEFMTMQGGMGYVWGAGWPNHLATLAALAIAVAALALSLHRDANRPLFARSSASQVREERVATARLLLLLTLGGVLLTLGAVWAHTGFIGTISVSVFEDTGGQRLPDRFNVGTGYGEFADFMHLGGYVVQGIGAALLLRLAVDLLRAHRILNLHRRADLPSPASALAGVEASR